MKHVLILLVALLINISGIKAADSLAMSKPSAEVVFNSIKSLDTTCIDKDLIKKQYKSLSLKEKRNFVKLAMNDAQLGQMQGKNSVGMYVLAVILPPVAVGIKTNWGMPTVYNVLWTCLGWVPGVVHAFYILER